MVGKRKINSHTFCIDQQKKPATPKRNLTKADIAEELKAMQQINKTLEEENRVKLDRIKFLEERVIFLENQRKSSKNTVVGEYANKHCQTELEEPVFCYECEFPADDFHDLGEHMMEFHFQSACEVCDETFTTKEKLADHMSEDHEIEEKVKELSSHEIQCNFCEQKFTSLRNLMIHKKQQHLEQISLCWDFATGNCSFGDDKCWFRHSELKTSEVKCKICDDKFATKSDYKKHRKQNHPGLVPMCKEVESRKICKYGIHCWFKHKEHEELEITNNETLENKNIDKNEVIEKLLDKIEKISERITQLEQAN